MGRCEEAGTVLLRKRQRSICVVPWSVELEGREDGSDTRWAEVGTREEILWEEGVRGRGST